MHIHGSIQAREVSGPFAGAAAVFVLMWLATIVVLGDGGAFHAETGEPPLATLTAMLLPPAIFLTALTRTQVRAQVLAIDPVWLAAVHGLRILGAGFLVAWAYGQLPGLFAHAAGWGDVLVALLAPFAAAALARRPELLRSRRILAFHVFGMLDFLGAVVTGLIARGTVPFLGLEQSTAALSQFPLLLIPCFAVPLWICLHIAAFVQIRAAWRR